MNRFASVALLLGLWLVWGYNWIVTKEGMAYASPFALAVGRTVFAIVTLFGAMLLLRKPLAPTPWRPTLLIGLTQTAGFTAFTNLALLLGGAGKVSVLCYTMPFWTLLFAHLFLGERVRGWQWLAVLLALSGLMAILEPWRLAAGGVSNWLAIGGGVSWAASAILVKRLRMSTPGIDSLSLTFWQLLWGGIPLLVLYGLFPGRALEPGWPLFFILLFAGSLAGGLGWLVWTVLLNRLSAGAASLNILAIPAIAVLAAWLQLDEAPNPSEMAGMGLIALALALLAWLAVSGDRRLRQRAHAKKKS